MKASAFSTLFPGMAATRHSTVHRSWAVSVPVSGSGRPPLMPVERRSEGRLRLPAWAARAVGLLSLWRQRTRARRQLRDTEDHILEDIGLSREDWLDEISKPFWR